MKRTGAGTTNGMDEFDSGNRAAELVRSLVPPDVVMEPEARGRVISRVLGAKRKATAPVPRRSPARAVLAPAAALVVVAMVVAGALLPLFLFGEKSAPPALAARVDGHGGEVEVRGAAGWRKVSSGEKLRAASSIRTGEDSSASVRFPGGSVMQVSDRSEARILSLERGSVEVAHVTGGTYHRSRPGTAYVVSSRGVSSRAAGSAFNVDSRQPGRIEILCVENHVQVAISSHEPIEVAEGQVMTVSTRREKRAERAPVSRERLLDERLCASVKRDAEAGFSTGIYRELDVTLDAPAEPGAPAERPVELKGTATGKAVSLEWAARGNLERSALVLLRSELSEPSYPANEIARYTDTSINSSADDSVSPGRTYQYRIAALSHGGEVAGYSNTLVIPVKGELSRVDAVSISLKATARGEAVTLDWGVTRVGKFNGFLVERTVQKAPAGSQTPRGTTSTRRIETSSVFFTYSDDTVSPGHSYAYRVGLIVDGAIMLYSEPVTVDTVRP